MSKLRTFSLDNLSDHAALVVNLLIALAMVAWIGVVVELAIASAWLFAAGLLVIWSPWIVSAWNDTRPAR